MKLEIKNLCVSVGGKQIVRELNLTINQGEVHVLMGPNGSGKSTLANAIMGNPKYKVDSGDVLLDGKSILELSTDKRAKKGLFMSFQHPIEVPGVGMLNFLRTAVNSVGETKPVHEFRQLVKERMNVLGMDESFAKRHLNCGFSGGEKKISEILQMALLKPRIAILDEPDSGLDIDSLKVAAESIKKFSGETGMLLITHYNRMLKYIAPDRVHVLVDGRIVSSGNSMLATQLEEKGYENLTRKENTG